MEPKIFCLVLFLCQTSVWCAQPTRTVITKQGPVRGLKIDLRPNNQALGLVDAFLGIPYAGAPVGPLRFMPPTSPQPWTYLREVTEFAPVCPQILPDLNDTQKALEYMTVGRLDYLKNLMRYLHDQSEDCLYLNIYTPSPRNDKVEDKLTGLPVLVFVHGESYEWNSGNPYDGSVLAAYGQVVVITLNYRLGVLGFLRPGLHGDVVTNFGLLDQIAALHWIQENIVNFGGDPNLITMIGHGTGASLVSLLLTSPVAQAKKGLFRRAILMSGTSLSPMSMSQDSDFITSQVASKLDCSTKTDEILSRCLKQKPLEDIHKILFQLDVPKYSTPFGPVVDRLIVPNDPNTLMSDPSPTNSYFKYDVMMGLTEIEAFHLFPASTATYGVSAKEQKKIVREFLKHTFKTNVDQIQTAVMNEYIDYRYTEDNHMVNRNTLLSILSDARVAAPLLQSAKYHAKHSEFTNTFFYVFKHVTKYGHYPEVYGSIHGEDLAYILGMPLTGGSFHLQMEYTRQEAILSEIMMQYWISFAKTGNASGSLVRSVLLSSEFDEPIEDFAPTWPSYDMDNQKYMAISLEPDVKAFYRPHKIALWNHLIPDLVRLNLPDEKPPVTEKPEIFPKFPEQASPGFAASPPHQEIAPGLPPEDITIEATRPPITINRIPPKKVPSYGLDVEAGVPIVVVIIIGLILLLLNLCACIGVVYQKHRVRQREHNLRMRIKRLSDVGMISNNIQDNTMSHQVDEEDVDGYCTGGSYNGDRCGDRQHGGEKIYGDSSDEETVEVLVPQHYAMDADGVYPVVHVGSLKSSLKRTQRPLPSNNRSVETLFQSLPDRSDLHKHSKSMSNFPHYDSSIERRHYQHQQQQPLMSNYAIQYQPHLDNGSSIRSKSAAAINTLPRQGPIGSDHSCCDDESDGPQAMPKRLGLPKVLPDLPSVCQFLSRRKANSSRPPSPIIEVVPVAQYEAMYPSRKVLDTSFQEGSEKNFHGGVIYPIYQQTGVRQDFSPRQGDFSTQQSNQNLFARFENPRNHPHQPFVGQNQSLHHQSTYVPQQQPFLVEEIPDERPSRPNHESGHKVAFTLPNQQAPPMRLPLSTLTSAPNKKQQYKEHQKQVSDKAGKSHQTERPQNTHHPSAAAHHPSAAAHQPSAAAHHPSAAAHHPAAAAHHNDKQLSSHKGDQHNDVQQSEQKHPQTSKHQDPPKQPSGSQTKHPNYSKLRFQDEPQKMNKEPDKPVVPENGLQQKPSLQEQPCQIIKDDPNLQPAPKSSNYPPQILPKPQIPFQLQTKVQPQAKNSPAIQEKPDLKLLNGEPLPEREETQGCVADDKKDNQSNGGVPQTEGSTKDPPADKSNENGSTTMAQPPKVRGPAWLAFNKTMPKNLPQKGDSDPESKGTPKPEPAPLACDETLDEGSTKHERPKTPVLRKVGEKTPPGTLKRDRPVSSCKSWCSQYSQTFLAKTIDTPVPNVEPMEDEDEKVSVL